MCGCNHFCNELRGKFNILPIFDKEGKKVRNIGIGAWGEDVVTLQKMLNTLGYSLKEDGIFGVDTKRAVEDFQNIHSDNTGAPLMVDGIVGPRTWWAITHTDVARDDTTPTSRANRTLFLALAAVVGGYVLIKS
jgi:peptidoglycan hydrolase-like protein with peptidoglycan-binding domain